MNVRLRFPQISVAYALSQRERNKILDTLDHRHEHILAVIDRFAPREPLVLHLAEMTDLAGALAEVAIQDSTPSTRALIKIAERMYVVTGQMYGLLEKPRPRPNGCDGDSEHRRVMQNALKSLTGATTLAEMSTTTPPAADSSAYLVPDFKAMALAVDKAARPPNRRRKARGD